MDIKQLSFEPCYGVILETGEVYSFISDKILKYFVINSGYAAVSLCKRKYLVHRLIASFIPNPLNKPQVNHKDGNKLNNKLNNLEWVTVKENQADAIKRNPWLKEQKHNAAEIAKINNMIKIIAIKGKEKIEFNSLKDCGTYFNTRPANVSRWLNGKRNCSLGYKFKRI